MKKLLMSLLILVLIVGGVAWYLLDNLDSMARRTIESAGSAAMGTPVRVGSVSVDLMAGNATINNLTVANPPGFSNQDMIRFEQLHVDIELRSLNSDIIRINRVTSTDPYVLYEVEGDRANLDVIRERFPPADPDAEPVDPEREIVLSIGEIVIDGIQGSLQADRLPRDVNVNLGDIRLENLEGTPPVIARQVVRPLIDQLSNNAGRALVLATADLLAQELSERAAQELQELREQAEERLGGLDPELLDAVEDTVRDLGDRLGDLLRRN